MEAFSFALEGVSDHLKDVYHRKGVFCHLVDELLQGSQVFFGRLSAEVGEELDQSFLFALEVVGSLLDHVLLNLEKINMLNKSKVNWGNLSKIQV